MIREGLTGFVFSAGGRVAGTSGTGDAADLTSFLGGYQFRVLCVHRAFGGTPAWADAEVAGKPARLNPDISVFRLYDCLWFAAKDWDYFQARPNPEMFVREFGPGGRERFAFTYLADYRMLLIDTLERIAAHHPAVERELKTGRNTAERG